MTGTRILVTGANGFVGTRTCEALRQAGFVVRAAVRDDSRACAWANEHAIVGALSGETDWRSAVEGVDSIIHLAARVHVMDETAVDPLEAFRRVNVAATEALARAAIERGVRRLVYVSSIKVNGESTGAAPFTATDPARPVDPYGISKWQAEQSLHAIARDGPLEVAIVRPPLVYGPHVGGNFLRLMRLVLRGAPLPLGRVRNQRSMIYNGNLADALIACATRPAAAGKTYLLSDGEDVSTPRLVRDIGSLMGRKVRLLPVPTPLLELAGKLTGKAPEVERLVGSLRIDASQFRHDLAWSPPYSVAQGLAQTVRWFVDAEK